MHGLSWQHNISGLADRKTFCGFPKRDLAFVFSPPAALANSDAVSGRVWEVLSNVVAIFGRAMLWRSSAVRKTFSILLCCCDL